MKPLSREFKIALFLVPIALIGLLYNLIRRPSAPPESQTIVSSTPQPISTPAKPDTPAELLAKRQAFIHILENNMLDQGHDFYLSLHGQNEDELQVKYVLMSRPFVHNFTRKYKENMRVMAELGFTKIVFTDGYDETWTVPLK